MKRILIIGDDSSLLRAGIDTCEYQVDTATTLEEAERKRSTGNYDQVMIDPDLLARLGMQLLPSPQHVSAADSSPTSQPLDVVIDSAPVGICVLCGADLRARRANPAYLRFLEEPHRSWGIVGLRPHDFIPRAQESGVVELMEKVARTGESYTNPEYEHTGFDRGITYWYYSLLPLSTDDPEVFDVMIIANEITDQVFARKCIEKMAERSVANLAQLQAIMHSMTDGLVVFDLQGNVIDMNPAALRIHGFESVHQATRHLSEFPETFELRYLDGSHMPVDEWPMARVIKGETFADLEVEVHRIDTGEVWVGSYGGTSVANSSGQASLGIITLRNVTDQKRAQSEREAIVELLRLGNQPQSFDDLMNTLVHYLKQWSGCESIALRLEEQGDFPYYVTKGFNEDFVSAENSLCALGLGGELLIDCDGNPELECMCGNVLCDRFDPSKPYFTGQGSFWTNSVDELEPWMDKDPLLNGLRGRCVQSFKSVALIPLRSEGEMVGMIQLNDPRDGRFDPRRIALLEEVSTIIANVVSRKRAEQALLKSNESLQRYQLLSQHTRDIILVMTEDGGILEANEAALSVYGYNRNEILSLNIRDLRTPSSHDLMQQQLAKAKAEGVLFEAVHIRKDGTPIPVEVSSRSAVIGGQPVLLSIVRDITERKLVDDALRDSTARFKLLSETSGQLLLSDAPQQIVNQLCTRVMEYLDCHAFFNFLVDDERGCLHLNACAGIPEETAKEIEWLDYGVAVCGCAARDGCRIVAENIMETPDPRTELVKSFGIQAYACHPLLGQGGKIIGTLSFGTRSRTSFTSDELALMKTVADQVAIAMERIRLLQSEQRRAAELESFISSMADGLILLDAQGNIRLVNDAGNKILGVSPDESFVEYVRRCRFATLDGEPFDLDQAVSNKALQGLIVRDMRYKVILPDGREVVVSISASPVRDTQGQVIGATAVFRDQTERVAFEQQKQELYEREHRIAEILQQAIIPPQLAYNIPGYRIAVRYQPALREAEVGGDFYDIFELGDGRVGILIGDVAGKGLAAAIRVAAARHAIRSYAYLDASPGVVMTLANESLSKDHVGVMGMLTAFFAVVDTRESTLTYANGGHEPPLIKDSTGQVHELSLTGRALGVMGGYTYTEASRVILPGDTLVMFTDGITEARTPNSQLYGSEGVVSFLENASGTGPDEIASGLLDVAAEYAGGSLQDDAAVVVLRLEEGIKRSTVKIREYTQEISDSTKDLPLCRTATLEMVSSMGFTEYETDNIVCAVFEACANAVVHGNKGSTVPVSFRISAYEDRFEAVVKDFGDGFTCPVVSPIPPPSSYRGRGIPLMRVYMDEVKVDTNGGCQVTLIKYLSGRSQSRPATSVNSS